VHLDAYLYFFAFNSGRRNGFTSLLPLLIFGAFRGGSASSGCICDASALSALGLAHALSVVTIINLSRWVSSIRVQHGNFCRNIVD